MNTTIRRSFAIIGSGAVGGFYGARLQRAGFSVHFLLNHDYPFVRDNGLRIDSKDGNFQLPHVNAYDCIDKMPPCDVVIIALKTVHNAILPQLLPSLIKPNGCVLVLQNGLGIEQEIAKVVGTTHVLGGLCFICSNKMGPGHICHLASGHIALGEYLPNDQAAGITLSMKDLADDFTRAGIKINLSEDLNIARWKKLVWNIPYNGLSVVLDATTDQLMKNPLSRMLVKNIMQEVIVGAAACKHSIADTYVQEMLDYTDSMISYKTSMKIDYDEKRPMEVEAIFGNPLRAIVNAHSCAPRIEMLYQELNYLDKKK
jgi:2-dehydropantoate 2-reductase